MSLKHHNLSRCITLLTAALQLAVVPATFTLHLGCDDSHHEHHADSMPGDFVACVFGHQCDCGHDHSGAAEEDVPASQSHDCQSCQVCRSAFALVTADLAPLRLEIVGNVALVATPPPQSPVACEPRCVLSRGPPSPVSA